MILRAVLLTLFSTALIISAYTGVNVLNIGDKAGDFSLENVDGKSVSLSDYKDAKGYIVIFTCNTCPYAQAYEDRIIALHKKYSPLGYPVVAINPNDPNVKPGDSFEAMKERIKEKDIPYAYLFDETQEVANAYGATHTPHVYILKKDLTVAYIGAIDNNHKDANAADKKYVEDALNALIEGKDVKEKSTKAIGCTIKWRS